MRGTIRNAYSNAYWMRNALCAEHPNPEWWTGASSDEIARAIALCRTCPVKDACLAFALDTHVGGSVWGGTTPSDRRHLRREGQRP